MKIRKFRTSVLFFTLILILSATSLSAQESETPGINRYSVISAAREIMGSQTYCALITLDSSGVPQVRTMNPFPPDENMIVWAATNTRSRKAAEIKNNPNVCLYYANHKNAEGYVSISGTAELITDPAEITKREREYWKQAFPEREFLVLIKIIPKKIEVVNYKRGMYGDPVKWRAPYVIF